MKQVRPEFAFHRLNDRGIQIANDIANRMDDLLTYIESVVPQGRELAIVKTKLEEASFFAKKGMAMQAWNQYQQGRPLPDEPA